MTFFILTDVAAQNLVPNPSFEVHSGCPSSFTQLYYADDWDVRVNTPDYFHKCGTGNFTTPNASFGYQCPETGNGFAGIYSYHEFNPNGNEFIGSLLTTPLVSGQTYYIHFKSNLATLFNCGIDGLGVVFTNVFYGDTLMSPPSFQNNYTHVQTQVSITDTLNWTSVSGTFVADSAYQYILIGNFYDTANVNLTCSDSLTKVSYYYIDDICVSLDSLDCTDSAMTLSIVNFYADTTVLPQGSCTNFNVNTLVDYGLYQWQFPGGTPASSTDSMPNVCYNDTGVYAVTLIASDSGSCGDTILKSNYITVVPACAPSTVSTSASICQGDSVLVSGIWVLVAGTYYDTLVSVQGCDSVVITDVSVDPLPAMGISGLDSSYCITDAAITLTGLPAGGSFSGAGVSDSVFDPGVAGAGMHNISYSFTDTNGCTNIISQTVNVIFCTGVRPSLLLSSLRFYPNPAGDKLYIVSNSNVPFSYEIYDLLGREVLVSATGFEGKAVVNLRGLVNGVYFVRVIAGEKVVTRKLVKD